MSSISVGPGLPAPAIRTGERSIWRDDPTTAGLRAPFDGASKLRGAMDPSTLDLCELTTPARAGCWRIVA
jgi:hypothetical protein